MYKNQHRICTFFQYENQYCVLPVTRAEVRVPLIGQPLTLYDMTCIFYIYFFSGQFENEYAICGVCDMTCNTCRGPSPTDCLTCDFGHWLEDGQCVPFCKPGYFPFEVSCISLD